MRLRLDKKTVEPEALRGNQYTVEYLETIADAEGLDLVGTTGNPTEGGIHAKWLLARMDGVKWSVVGSWNGGESGMCPPTMLLAVWIVVNVDSKLLRRVPST